MDKRNKRMSYGYIEFKVYTLNSLGISEASAAFSGGVTIQTVPDAPISAPTTDSSSESSISISWIELVNNGGSAITAYRLAEKIGNSNYVDIQNTATKSYTESTTSGQTYTFKYYASNKFGESIASSPELVVKALNVPTIPAAPQNSLSASTVTISWVAPYTGAGFGVEISEYEIQIKKADSSWFSAGTICDGTDATIIAATQCSFSLITLETYCNLDDANTITSRLRAKNEKGWTTYSGESSGIGMQTKPDSPSNLLTKGSATSQSQIEVTWVAVPSAENGQSPITSYSIEMSGPDGVWNVLCGVSTAYTDLNIITSSVSSGTEYNFRYKVSNIHGWSDYSSIVAIKAISLPSKPSPSVKTNNDITTGNIELTWTTPLDTFAGGIGVALTDHLASPISTKYPLLSPKIKSLNLILPIS